MDQFVGARGPLRTQGMGGSKIVVGEPRAIDEAGVAHRVVGATGRQLRDERRSPGKDDPLLFDHDRAEGLFVLAACGGSGLVAPRGLLQDIRRFCRATRSVRPPPPPASPTLSPEASAPVELRATSITFRPPAGEEGSCSTVNPAGLLDGRLRVRQGVVLGDFCLLETSRPTTNRTARIRRIVLPETPRIMPLYFRLVVCVPD